MTFCKSYYFEKQNEPLEYYSLLISTTTSILHNKIRHDKSQNLFVNRIKIIIAHHSYHKKILEISKSFLFADHTQRMDEFVEFFHSIV